MRQRWILCLVLCLLVGRAWGVHLPSWMAQDATCHGPAVPGHAGAATLAPASHGEHLLAERADPDVADAGGLSSEGPSTPADALYGDGHVCCLVLVGFQDQPWVASAMSWSDRPTLHWASASRPPDLRPPISGR